MALVLAGGGVWLGVVLGAIKYYADPSGSYGQAPDVATVVEQRSTKGPNMAVWILGGPFVGVLIVRALPFSTHVGAPDVWKLPCVGLNLRLPNGSPRQRIGLQN